jgi:hypothetical protein
MLRPAARFLDLSERGTFVNENSGLFPVTRLSRGRGGSPGEPRVL